MDEDQTPAEIARSLSEAQNIAFDGIVRQEDARSSGKPGECYCGAKVGHHHANGCVIIQHRMLEATPVGVWQPIDTYQDGDFVLFWFPNGEKGRGGKETAMAFRDDDGLIRDGWTHGGPNSGSDFEFCEPPTMWCRLPDDPQLAIRAATKGD